MAAWRHPARGEKLETPLLLLQIPLADRTRTATRFHTICTLDLVRKRSQQAGTERDLRNPVPEAHHAVALCFLTLTQWLATTTAITGRDDNVDAHGGNSGLVQQRTKRYSGTAVLAPLFLPAGTATEFWENDWLPSR
jgi:hypothetical protein